MAVLVTNSPLERIEIGVGISRIVARGVLDMAAAAWVGAHPGFADVVTDNGVGDFDVHLNFDGTPATMIGRATTNYQRNAGPDGPLHGAGNRDLRVRCVTYEGADSNPGGGIAGWDAGANAVLGAAIDFDGIVCIEVIDVSV